MANFKATFFFESQQQATLGTGSSLGWTESWYKTMVASPEAALLDPDLQKYVELRRMCLASIYRMTFIRVSDDDNPRRFKLANIAVGDGVLNSEVAAPPAQVQCALLADLERLPLDANPHEKVHHRRFLIRGLPSGMIDGNVLNPNFPAFAQIRRFLDYVGRHSAGTAVPGEGQPRFSWGAKYLDPSVTPTTIVSAIVTPWDDQVIGVRPVVAPATVRGTRFTIRGVDSPREFNRTWQYVNDSSIDAVTHSIFQRSRRKIQGSYTGPGAAVYYQNRFLYGPFDQYVIIGLRNKKTGRVFRQLRGRSSSR